MDFRSRRPHTLLGGDLQTFSRPAALSQGRREQRRGERRDRRKRREKAVAWIAISIDSHARKDFNEPRRNGQGESDG